MAEPGTGLGAGGMRDAARMTSIANTIDHYSLERIASLEIPCGAAILDVGTGTGSLAAALAEHRPDARVVALDRDTTPITESVRRTSNLTVVAADVTEWRPSTTFDLIHARFVLCHVAERDRVVAELCSWLNPGGWLVLTEPYQLTETDAPSPAVGRVFAAYRDYATSTGTSLTWIRSVPALLSQSGLRVDVHARAGRFGGGPDDRWSGLLGAVQDQLAADETDLAHLHATAATPGWLDIPQVVFTVIGRAPEHARTATL
ncbi:class I SAM-dependent methyltransferase [Nocardia sp. NBC_00508]|uniref:class I SAM-dependent methyltransferase n=1 Tax=Nocardia sp. NBC_00508 TaxID=2975992 RepID=UPI002E8216A4|nr:class I SAM-dependent methyltransferase [Nocardia sp. NBC_00508]WUD67138.1 class I SAM-dependent methyltransferase [Nocardia sp. NBC_00508]